MSADGRETTPSTDALPAEPETRKSRWSFRVGRLFGIDIRLHVTLVILLGWIGVAAFVQARDASAAAAAVGMVIVLFATIVLHEVAHALTARRFGIRTRDITLLPIGGVSALERSPHEPWQEAVISLAGPALNVVIAAVVAAMMFATDTSFTPADLSLLGGAFLPTFFWMNVMLATFNLLPAFPMDGGRVLRALLATRLDAVRATTIAARTGQALAVAFGIIGLFVNPLLLVIALFVWMGAEAELSSVRLRSSLHDARVRSATMTDLEALGPEEPLARAVDVLLAGYQRDFPVIEDGRAVGVLTRSDIVQGLAEGGPMRPVGSAMHRRFETIDADRALEGALDRLTGASDVPAVVVDEDHVIGLLTAESVGELVMTRDAARGVLPRGYRRVGTAGRGGPAAARPARRPPLRVTGRS